MIKNILDITWKELKSYDNKKTCAFVSVSPIEEHGPYLPLGTDIYLSDSWVDGVIKECHKKWPSDIFIKYPCLFFGFAEIGYFPGNNYIEKDFLYEILLKYISNIAESSVKNIIIISGHADPFHIITIEKVCDEINRKYGEICFSPSGALFSGIIPEKNKSEISEKFEKFPDDFHAGWIETSSMLFLNKKLVKEGYKKAENFTVKDYEMINLKKYYEIMKENGYIGYPRESDEETGEILQKETISKLFFLTEKFIDRIDYKKYSHHFLYGKI
ncbi:MAG TPA: creatininase family protein [Tepiditoga sp.]|nr:creatininase family protein [Thermotogota bacterium]HOO75821.1 creatininase family protein [Tepiditoga sp.]